MNNLEQLWQSRLRRFVHQLIKYGRLMLNDHFSVVLVAIIGFGGIFYKELLTQLQVGISPVHKMAILIGIAIGLSSLLTIGSPIWLMKVADKSYLLAQGEQWHAYWKKGIVLGYGVSLVPIGLTIGMVMPLVAVLTSLSLSHGWLLFVLVAIWKGCAVWHSYMRLYTESARNTLYLVKPWSSWFIQLQLFVCVMLLFTQHSFWGVGLIVGLILDIVCCTWFIWQRVKKSPVHFEALVEADQVREARFYKWVAIFADVPQSQPIIKRSRWSDYLLSQLKTSHYQSYLYVRILWRHTAYRGIWIRLLVFTACLLSVSHSVYLSAGLGVMSGIATSMQLVPVIHHYRRHEMYRLYPQFYQEDALALRIPLSLILYLQTIVYSVVVVARFGLSGHSSVIVGVWLLSAYALAYYYPLMWHKKSKGRVT